MQFLYQVRPLRSGMLDTPTSHEREILERHGRYLRGLAEEGSVILFGRTTNADERTFGLVVFEADSAEAAERIMQNDPVVHEGVMSGELFPYRVAYYRHA